MARHRSTPGHGPESEREDIDPVDGPAVRVDDPAAMRADDMMLDELAARRALDLFPAEDSYRRTAREDAVASLLASWREDLRPDDLPAVPSLGRADWALRRGQRRGFRPMVAAAAAIAMLLVGSALVGSRMARPGDPLWGLTRVLWTDRVDSADAEHAAQDGLTSAQDELNKGHLSGASIALTFVSATLPRVQSRDDLDQIRRTYESLASQVSSRMDSENSSSSSVAAAARSAAPHTGGAPATSAPAPPSVRTGTDTVVATPPVHRGSTRSAASHESSSAAVVVPTTPSPDSGGGATTTPVVALPVPASSTSPSSTSGTTSTPTTSSPTPVSSVTSTSAPTSSADSTTDVPNLDVTSSTDSATDGTSDTSIPAAVPTTLPTTLPSDSSTDDPSVDGGQQANLNDAAAVDGQGAAGPAH